VGVHWGPEERVQLFGGRHSREAYAIRDFLTRSVVRYEWHPVDTEEESLREIGEPLADAGLPLVVLPSGEALRNPAVEEIARVLGWVRRPRFAEYDLSIYGAGPAGLSAAVYAASEGLRVVVIEREVIGGQAGSSSLIENYLGFPHGIRGVDLAERARQQAVDFGAEFLLMREGVRGIFRDGRIHGELADGTPVVAAANICATGIEWRRMGVEGEDRLIGAGVYYGAGMSEAPQCEGEHVIVVGGANSAGQAAMNLVAHAASVTMVVRGPALSDTMSAYLSNRIVNEPRIRVLLGTRVVGLTGQDDLVGVVLEDADGRRDVDATRMFVCIGGEPNTDWTQDTLIHRDDHGYLITGPDLTEEHLADRWSLARAPYHLETSVPGSFAAGDVRLNSVKRVASAVGEGAMAVTFVHRHLSETFGMSGPSALASRAPTVLENA
jgi:thioredoxin reductase (NADPH)